MSKQIELLERESDTLEEILSSVRLKRMKRKTLGLYIIDDQVIEVRVPTRCPKYLITEFLTANLDWILERKQSLSKQAQIKKQWLFFKGERFQKRVLPAQKSSLQFQSGQITLYVPSLNPSDEAKVWEDWLREEGRRHYEERVLFWFEILKSIVDSNRISLSLPAVKIRKMRTRWGSCSSRGHINLALHLLEQPLDFIDQVIVHELCHLVEFNHSSRFYGLMDKVMPNWRQAEPIVL